MLAERRMGLAYGVVETFCSLAIMLAPLLAGVLYARQPVMVYWISAALVGSMLVVTAIFTPRTAGSAERETIMAPPEL